MYTRYKLWRHNSLQCSLILVIFQPKPITHAVFDILILLGEGHQGCGAAGKAAACSGSIPYGQSVGVLAAPLIRQRPANASGKAAEISPGSWASVLMWETQTELQAANSGLAQPQLLQHLGCKPSDRGRLSPSLTPLCVCVCGSVCVSPSVTLPLKF